MGKFSFASIKSSFENKRIEMKPQHTIVLMPDNSLLEVDYYCISCTSESNQKDWMNLIIQFDDCVDQSKIKKSLAENKTGLETTVHNKVINSKGHLCF